MSGRVIKHGRERSVKAEPEKIRGLSSRDFAIRFAFGAAISLLTALAGQTLGKRIGGELLALPAILPASLTLIESKEDRLRAEADSRGALLGGIGLVAFALAGLLALTRLHLPALGSLGLALLAWAVVAAGLFLLVYGTRARD